MSEKRYEHEVEVRQQLQDRQAQLRDLRTRYGKYGEAVAEVVIEEQSREGTLRKMVHRITGRYVPERSRQHRALIGFLDRHGTDVFLRQAGIDPSGSQARRSRSGPHAPNVPVRAKANGKTVRQVRLPNGQIITDRRSGHERRSGRDRRQLIEVIYKNNRFGRDRRNARERRRTPSVYVD
jgi:hypothetical protein